MKTTRIVDRSRRRGRSNLRVRTTIDVNRLPDVFLLGFSVPTSDRRGGLVASFGDGNHGRIANLLLEKILRLQAHFLQALEGPIADSV